jgi:hypothetical protein
MLKYLCEKKMSHLLKNENIFKKWLKLNEFKSLWNLQYLLNIVISHDYLWAMWKVW